MKHVSTREFEANPNMIWDYDVMMHGTWDANGVDKISTPAVNVISRYIDAGKGVLIGHDTIGYSMGKEHGMGLLAEKFNLFIGNYPTNPPLTNIDSQTAWHYGSRKVKITKKGFLTQYPWNLGPVGTVLDIPFSHTTSNAAKDNTWMEFVDGRYFDRESFGGMDVATTDEEARTKLPNNINIKYYLTTWNNTAMIQTGHSNGDSTEDERKVLANTLFYLKQLTKKTEVLDNSARDIADPNKVSNISTVVDEVNNVHVKFRRPEDNGSTYEYYVKGVAGDTEFRSDTKSATITTGVKKYKYGITEGNTNPVNWYEIETSGENESINIGSTSYIPDKYIHIRSIDGAGNESEVYTQKLEKPENQELEVKKEVVNPKNEYKVGDRITYKVSVRIKENETNRGRITDLNFVDTYNTQYLRLAGPIIPNDNSFTVNTDEQGKIKTNLTILFYGETKELQYDMEILDTANGKGDVANNVTASGSSFTRNSAQGNANKKIVVNDPKIEIQKSMDKLEYKVGDEVIYKVKVKSLVPRTILRNVNIEETIPKGLDLKENSAKISINGRTLESGVVKTKEGDITKVSAGLTEINRK